MQPFASVATDEDVVMDFGAESDAGIDRAQRFRHPGVVVFHLLFRSLAFFVFLFSNIIFSANKSFITPFVFIILFLCCDFWTVKNVSGRLLVGLRWWNYVDDAGNSHWVFEQAKSSSELAKRKYSPHESRIFWLSLVIFPVIWTIFFFVNILSPRWLMVSALGFGLNGANLYGYLRCKFGAHSNMRDVATKFVGQKLMENVFSSGSGSETRRRSEAGERRTVPTMDGEVETI